LTNDHNERELEQGLVEHITHFLLELGAGFAYIGRQVPLQVGERDFFLDLLFYHTQLLLSNVWTRRGFAAWQTIMSRLNH